MISAAPATIRGMLIARPRISSGTLPLAAAATAITLSRLITMSAIDDDLHRRPQMRRGMDAVLVLLLRHQQLCRDHEQRQAADQLEIRQFHQGRDDAGEDDAQDDGAPAPKIMPHSRWRGASPRHAIAITSALSPDSRTLIQMILPTATQKAGWVISLWNWVKKAAMFAGSKICHNQFTALSFRPGGRLWAAMMCAACSMNQPTISLPEKNCAISIAAVSGASEPCTEFSPIDFA